MENTKSQYIALIPARGGSKRIPQKNLSILNGQPLISYVIRAAQTSKLLTKIVVSTDSQAIADYAESLGIDVPFLRPKELSEDNSLVIEAIQHYLKVSQIDVATINGIVLLQPTSPFVTGQQIDQAIRLFESGGVDTITAVTIAKDHPYYCWKIANGELKPFFSLETQAQSRMDIPLAYIETGSIYVSKPANILAGSLYGQKILPLIIDSPQVDIDTPADLDYAEYLMKANKG